ncbi:baculoviral iap repeat-containing protein 8 [Plakobranchus ocellatus]|uniref:Baculoviral iap repeat-containing protein 8 n=1 Tax=Plakobranchus ocellatus TaxID=259542 RepID=A0AAV4A799_9GAST|nr:baculoviral iap repeat-containing protein 8 [Plakobranchus ocellatus]
MYTPGEHHLSSEFLEQRLAGLSQRSRNMSAGSAVEGSTASSNAQSSTEAPGNSSFPTESSSSSDVSPGNGTFSTAGRANESASNSSNKTAGLNIPTLAALTVSDTSSPGPSELGPQLNEDARRDIVQRLMQAENALLTERMHCSVCRVKPVECVYLPCGHVVACKDCAAAATTCIQCNATVGATANIYLS